MALKEFFKKFLVFFQINNVKKNDLNFTQKFSLIIYPIILLLFFIIYSITYNSINNKKNENEKNLENFFDSKEFSNIKKSFFEDLKSPYIEFSYAIENNDSIGRILKKFRVSNVEIQTIIKGLKESILQ